MKILNAEAIDELNNRSHSRSSDGTDVNEELFLKHEVADEVGSRAITVRIDFVNSLGSFSCRALRLRAEAIRVILCMITLPWLAYRY